MVSGSPDAARPTIYVSMVRLLASPSRYVDYPVAVAGYLGSSGTSLYLSVDHANLRDSGVPISIAYRDVDISEHGIARTGCEEKFVQIFGVFSNHNNEYQIRSVERIVTYDESAGLDFEDSGPSGGKVVCWPI
jgi:hypothetical protein